MKNSSIAGDDYVVAVDDRKIPGLVMWYLPLTHCLKRLFSNPRDAKLFTWHFHKHLPKNNKLRYPFHMPRWKKFNKDHPKFTQERRNLTMALSTDGMIDFGGIRNPHSTWPMILSIYNTPP